jgi:hypothetical protein
MTWKDVAARYPEFVSWLVQTHGPLPDGDVEEEEFTRFANEYQASR